MADVRPHHSLFFCCCFFFSCLVHRSQWSNCSGQHNDRTWQHDDHLLVHHLDHSLTPIEQADRRATPSLRRCTTRQPNEWRRADRHALLRCHAAAAPPTLVILRRCWWLPHDLVMHKQRVMERRQHGSSRTYRLCVRVVDRSPCAVAVPLSLSLHHALHDFERRCCVRRAPLRIAGGCAGTASMGSTRTLHGHSTHARTGAPQPHARIARYVSVPACMLVVQSIAEATRSIRATMSAHISVGVMSLC